jgi:hypothetical protein
LSGGFFISYCFNYFEYFRVIWIGRFKEGFPFIVTMVIQLFPDYFGLRFEQGSKFKDFEISSHHEGYAGWDLCVTVPVVKRLSHPQ